MGDGVIHRVQPGVAKRVLAVDDDGLTFVADERQELEQGVEGNDVLDDALDDLVVDELFRFSEGLGSHVDSP